MAPAVGALLLFSIPAACAYREYISEIPNGANIVVDAQPIAAVGHTNPAGGGARNLFGSAFQLAGNAWTTTLCMADSDGDGVLNGVELGDPCCRWSKGMAPERSDFLSHPGDSKSVSARGKCDCSVTPCFVPGDSPSPSPSVVAQPSPTPTIPESQEAKKATDVAIAGVVSGGILAVLLIFLLIRKWGAAFTSAATQGEASLSVNEDYALYEGSMNGDATDTY